MALYTLKEDECSDVSRSTVADPKVHCIIGTGYGGQYFATADWSWRGIWIQEVYEVDNGFKDPDGILVDRATKKLIARQNDYQWKATTKRELVVMPGDYIKFYPEHEDAEELVIASYEENINGELTLELGARQPDQLDAAEIEDDISSGYTSKYMQESHADVNGQGTDDSEKFEPADPAHIAIVPGELSWYVSGAVLADDLFPRVTLELSVSFDTTKVPIVGPCALELKWNELYIRYGNIIGWEPGLDIPEIDITDNLSVVEDPIWSGNIPDWSTGEMDWPDGTVMLEFVFTPSTGHTGCIGTLDIRKTGGALWESVEIDGAGTYQATLTYDAEPELTFTDLDCKMDIYALKKNVLKVGVYMANEYTETHASISDHPRLKASGTMHFWKRQDRS